MTLVRSPLLPHHYRWTVLQAPHRGFDQYGNDLLPAGHFYDGQSDYGSGSWGDETQHQVTLTNGFYLGKYEVTQAQYQTVMNGNSEGLNADPSDLKEATVRWKKFPGRMLKSFFPNSIPLSRPRGDCPTAGNMSCLRRPNGNMPAGRVRPRRTRGAMILILPMPITTGTVVLMMVTILSKPAMWECMRPTPGAFSTCTEMCGNGSATGGQTILPVPRPILRVRLRARIGSYGVVPGQRRAGTAFG